MRVFEDVYGEFAVAFYDLRQRVSDWGCGVVVVLFVRLQFFSQRGVFSLCLTSRAGAGHG